MLILLFFFDKIWPQEALMTGRIILG